MQWGLPLTSVLSSPHPVDEVAPTSAGRLLPARPPVSEGPVLAPAAGCSLVAGLALHHGATPVLALHCLQLRLKALQAPVLPILRWLQVVAHGAVGLVCRGGCRRQAQLRLLQDSGHEELPRGAAGGQGLGEQGGGAAVGLGRGYSRWSWGWRRRCSAPHH